MTEQQRLLRLLKLISSLASPFRRSVQEYAEWLEVNRSTVYRYLDTIKEAGYEVYQDDQKRPYLDRAILKRDHPSPSFTEEETNMLIALVRGCSSPLQSDVLNKIYVYSAQAELAESLVDVQQAVRYRTLSQAIQQQKQVVLKQYVSLNSGEERDRRVEPICFRHNDTTLEAYDTRKRAIRHFQLERIAEVKLCSKRFRLGKRHQSQDTDPYQVANLPQVTVELELSLSAAQQMKERYPGTKAYLEKQGKRFRFCAPVNEQFKILDAFLMGCCREARIIRPKALKEHIEEQWQQRTF